MKRGIYAFNARNLRRFFPDVPAPVRRRLLALAEHGYDRRDHENDYGIGDFPETRAWVRRCYNCPNDDDVTLHACAEAIGTYGVEGWSVDIYTGVSYCNTGDTYAMTVCTVPDEQGLWFASFETLALTYGGDDAD